MPINGNLLYYGDNLPILRKYVKDESVDLCYIDPPFNSKRNYNQIYNSIGADDKAQAQAFTDTWEWDHMAKEGLSEILENEQGRFTPQTIELIKGLRNLLKESSLFAYLISMTLRIVEIHRMLKPTGSFYLHCDPTASHYLKILLDGMFQPTNFRSEIIWKRTFAHGNVGRNYGDVTDTIFWYSKTETYTWNTQYQQISPQAMEGKYSFIGSGGRRWQSVTLRNPGVRPNLHYPYTASNGVTYQPHPNGWSCNIARMQKYDQEDRLHFPIKPGGALRLRMYADESLGERLQNLWSDIPPISANARERLGYPTQKPAALLERIIQASTNEGDTVLDAYCGCGTTVAVAQRLKRKWIGIDITYQSISLILKRLEETFGREVLSTISLDGIPKDMASATALAHKQDDRVRKEFEKWAVLTYSENRAMINQKKGADGGIDGTAYFMTSKTENEKIIFQVKSGNVGAKDIRDLRGTIEQEKAPLGIFITLQDPSQPMTTAAHAAGLYAHPLMQRNYDKIQIVTIREMIEKGIRLDMPLTHYIVKPAVPQSTAIQLELV